MTKTVVTPENRAFWARMYKARMDAGLSLDQAAAQTRALLSDDMSWGPGKETIRRLENGPSTDVTASVAFFIVALAKVYGVKLVDLSGELHDRIATIMRLAVDVGVDLPE